VCSGLIRWFRVKDGVLCVSAHVAAGLCRVYLCRVGADSRNTLSHGDHTSPIPYLLWFTRAHTRGCIQAVVFRRLYSGGCFHAVDVCRCTKCAYAWVSYFSRTPYSTKMSPVLCPPRHAPTHGDRTFLARHTP